MKASKSKYIALVEKYILDLKEGTIGNTGKRWIIAELRELVKLKYNKPINHGFDCRGKNEI